MQTTSVQSKPIIRMKDNLYLPYYKLLIVVEHQIESKRQLEKQNHNKLNPQLVRVQYDYLTQEAQSKSIMSNFSAFKPFKKNFCQNLFSQDTQDKKGPLNFVNENFIENNFYTFYKNLKKNSNFPNLIPVDTIVLARQDQAKIWPAKVTEFKEYKTNTKNNKIKYKLLLINRSKSIELFKYNILEFTAQNIEKLKEFYNDKKLLKALKVAKKLCQKNNNSVSKDGKQRIKFKSIEKKVLSKKIVNIILLGQQIKAINNISEIRPSKTENKVKLIKRESFISRVSNKFQTHNKWQPLELMIETPRINPKQFIDKEDSQGSQEQSVEQDDAQMEILKQQFNDNDETCFIQQGKNTNQEFFQSMFKNKNIKEKEERSSRKKNHFPKQPSNKQLNPQNRRQLQRILRYLYDYRLQLKRDQPNRKKKLSLDKVLIFLNQPLQKFNQQDFSKYFKIIDICIELCQNKSFKLMDHDQVFISALRKILGSIYNTLRDYSGLRVFMKLLKSNTIQKLKIYQDKNDEIKDENTENYVKREVKIQDK